MISKLVKPLVVVALAMTLDGSPRSGIADRTPDNGFAG